MQKTIQMPDNKKAEDVYSSAFFEAGAIITFLH